MNTLRLFIGFVMLFVLFSVVLAALWRWYKTLFAVGFICVFWVIYTSFQGPFAWKRSIPGGLARFVAGKVGAVQDVDDLVDEVSQPATVAALRAWAAAVLAGQHGREVPTAGVHYLYLLPCGEATRVPRTLAGLSRPLARPAMHRRDRVPPCG